MSESEEKRNGQINVDKANVSPRYENWYEAHSENPEIEYKLRLLRDEIFDGLETSTGRKFSEILFTSEELAERGMYTLSQEDVTKYESKKANKERERTLDKGLLFEPKIVLENIISPSQREDREEGLNRSTYVKTIQREVLKHLITSGCSVIDALSMMAKATQLATEQEWIEDDEWVGPNRLEEEEIDVKLAEKYAEIIGVDLEDLLLQQQRVEKINPSGPTYINTHDQHLIPSAQGGLSQRPVSIASHWFEHSLLAADSGEALSILLGQKELGALEESETIDRLIELCFFAYQINSQAAELLRASIPLSPSLSTKYILKKRETLCEDAREILNKTIALDPNNHLGILSEKEMENIFSLAQRITENRGNLPKTGESEEEEESTLTLDEAVALEKLELAVELIDRDMAINRLRSSLDSLRKTGKSKIDDQHIQTIVLLISRLEKGYKALYLHDMTEEEYKAILVLQEALDESILIDILIPTKIKNVRPAWRYRLDLENMGDILVNPYDDRGLDLRMLLDVLQEPNFERVFLTGAPPRRNSFTEEQLLDSYLSDKVYGNTRYTDILEGLVANEILDEYYRSLGIRNKAEILSAMFPEDSDEQPPSALQNVDRAAQIVYEALIEEHKIATVGDCDADGFFASINWRWTLEHVGSKKISQKFNTRLEGHSVQPIDLLNLALEGNQLLIINDTGSSSQDIETFSLIKNGIRSLNDLIFFRENLDFISEYNDLSKNQRKYFKAILTQFINRNYDKEDVITDTLLEDVKNTLGEKSYIPLAKFIHGFKDVKIIVCDHHTPSIEAIKFFENNEDVVMVNPEWVYHGLEDQFIKEMELALKVNKEGVVDIEGLNKIQQKYTCYPESDIVGTVTAGKVIKRLLQLLTDDEIVKAKDENLYTLAYEEREKKYRELAEEVAGIALHSSKETEGLPSNIILDLEEGESIKIFIGDLWLQKGSMNKIEKKLTKVVHTLKWNIEKIGELANREDALTLLADFEKNYSVTISSKNLLIDLIQEKPISIEKDMVVETLKEKIKNIYQKRIKELDENLILTKGELRFYLEYAGQLPKSFYLMNSNEKKEYIRESIKKISHHLDKYFYINLNERIENRDDLRDIKKDLFDIVEESYQHHEYYSGVSNLREKARYEGNKIWAQTIEYLLKHKELTEMDVRILNSYLKYGPFGLEFLELTEATTTLGDGGSVDLVDGCENRTIVRKGMRGMEEYVENYWSASTERKKELKRIEPEILRLIRTSLRGTHLKSVNWNLSRLLTHGVSAFVNAMYRRGKEERSQRAKEFWTEASDFCTRRSDNEATQRHRHTLIYAQEVAIKRREELFKEIVKELENDHGEIEKPIIITELKGRKYVDPTKGFRGLIAGQLANRYNKPTMVLVEEKALTNSKHSQYSVSFRLPGRGNVAADMVQLGLSINQVPGITILAHGGHPEAAGGTWLVEGGKERIHEVLDPIFSNYTVENPDAGIVKIEEVIEGTVKRLEEKGWGSLEDYTEYINSFDIADAIAINMYKQTNPYGVNMPGLLLEFEDLTVVNRSKGVKNDGDEYCNLIVRDKRGNVKTMRLFKNLADFNKIQKGDTVTLRAQPLMRLSVLKEGSLEYKWPHPNNPNEKIEVNTIVGQKSRPKLDIEKIVTIKRRGKCYLSEEKF